MEQWSKGKGHPNRPRRPKGRIEV